MNGTRQFSIKNITAILLASALVLPVNAEDTEIFADKAPPVQPNVLFVPDFSGSMNSRINGSNLSRIESLRNAFEAVTTDEDIKVNIGILGFSGKRDSATGGDVWNHGVVFPVAPIDNLAAPTLLSNDVAIGTAATRFTLDQDSLDCRCIL